MNENLKDHHQRSHTLSDCTPFQALLPSYFDATQLRRYQMWTRSLSSQHLLDAKTAVPWGCHSVCAETSILSCLASGKEASWEETKIRPCFVKKAGM